MKAQSKIATIAEIRARHRAEAAKPVTEPATIIPEFHQEAKARIRAILTRSPAFRNLQAQLLP